MAGEIPTGPENRIGLLEAVVNQALAYYTDPENIFFLVEGELQVYTLEHASYNALEDFEPEFNNDFLQAYSRLAQQTSATLDKPPIPIDTLSAQQLATRFSIQIVAGEIRERFPNIAEEDIRRRHITTSLS